MYKEIKKKFKKLKYASETDIRLLKVLAFLYEPMTQSRLYDRAVKLEIRSQTNLRITQKEIKEFRQKWLDNGVLMEHSERGPSQFQISDPLMASRLMREFMNDSSFEEVLRLYRQRIKREASASQYGFDYNHNDTYWSLMRDLRISIYVGDSESAEIYAAQIFELTGQFSIGELLESIFYLDFQLEIFEALPPELKLQTIYICLVVAQSRFEPTDKFWDVAGKTGLMSSKFLLRKLAEENLFEGNLADAANAAEELNEIGRSQIMGVIHFLKKEYHDAALELELMIKNWRAANRKRIGFPDHWSVFFYGLALYKTNEGRFHVIAKEIFDYSQKQQDHSVSAYSLIAISNFLRSNPEGAIDSLNRIFVQGNGTLLILAIVSAILRELNPTLPPVEIINSIAHSKLDWLAFEQFNLLKARNADVKAYSSTLRARFNDLGFEPVGNLIPRLSNWERALGAILTLAESSSQDSKKAGKDTEYRVIWEIDPKRKKIQPKEQKTTSRGWSVARNIALKRLYEGKYPHLKPEDLKVTSAGLKRERGSYYHSKDFYYFDWEKGLRELQGHPLVFIAGKNETPVEITVAEPALVLTEKDENIVVSFDRDFKKEGLNLIKETEARYLALDVRSEHLDILRSFSNKKLVVPREGRELLGNAIRAVSKSLTIHTDLEEYLEELPSVEADPRLHVLFTQRGDGFRVEMFVKPFGDSPPYFKPGRGNESVVAELKGRKTRTKRDLAEEKNRLDRFGEECSLLSPHTNPNLEWDLADVAECLTVLAELDKPRKSGGVILEWTKGEKIRLAGAADFGNLKLAAKGKNDWFEVSGELAVNENLVLTLQELRRILPETTGNYIELSDGQFVAITEKLRKYLDSIDRVLDQKGRVNSLRTGVLDDFGDQVGSFRSDKAWKERTRRIEEARNFVPVLPSTFDANLRQYQREGFDWLSRLAKWGVGACLADDMGLGKTLQSLAVLVDRAELGPALVVAPVSVCRNWVNEAARFAPTLNFHIFGPGDRTAMIERLGKYDVLVCGYGLLSIEESRLIEKEFATVVLDEAQAIKNRATKRSKTAMKLKGGFKLITTGTPIENHLGELWNLMNFLNPGLLGTLDFFNEKFATPIERDNDEAAKRTLQRVIKPFVLRRRKNEVLDDLPEKTEIVLNVEMSENERAFYESLRRDALASLENAASDDKDVRFRIFAELTRLRLACCNPRLVDETLSIESSKLSLFEEILDDLLDNQHKALVFSQFVKHLKIVEKRLQERGTKYQYLDGSTAPKKRQEAIDAFQRGEGDVFLISLKAGGTGLNLTAADYVVHLDPWWNPAVEDQATDRAHRIGQTRPVTVYRLVTENTVEEKILRLHSAKRDLADSLLSGTEGIGKLSVEDLMALFVEGNDPLADSAKH
ncbi:MAG: DEAD/DEAH box helicase [Pyrinomonadaceae bacterium]